MRKFRVLMDKMGHGVDQGYSINSRRAFLKQVILRAGDPCFRVHEARVDPMRDDGDRSLTSQCSRSALVDSETQMT